MKARAAIVAGLAALACMTIRAEAQQAPYPNRPITWILASAPGGVVDNSARFYAKVLSEKLGQPVVVDNRPGAGGIVGTESAAQAKADGYTILYASQGPFATFPWMFKKLSFDPLKSFAPVHGMADSSLLLMVNASSPFKTVEDLVDHLKKNPGKVNFGSSGAGTGTHLLGEMFQQATGTRMVHVPYKGGSALYSDLLNGVIDVIFDYTVVMRPHIEAGKLRPLAISREDRLKSLPNVPTFRERGMDVVFTAWASIVMPAGAPPEAIAKMSDAMAQTLRDPAILKYNDDNDFGNLGHLGPQKLREFFVSESEKFKKVIEKAGIEPQ